MSAGALWAETLKIATYNTELHRKGPGLLLRDIMRGEDPQIAAVVEVLVHNAPDIVALQGFDYDLTGVALKAFTKALRDQGLDYPHVFSAKPNTGMRTNIDMDGNRRTAEPRDTQGYGLFSGQGGMAILSKYPIVLSEVQDYSTLLWSDLPDALLPEKDGEPFPSKEAQDILRLSTTGHWVVPIDVPDRGRVTLLTFHASPPVFDGPEDRNGKRNHDEILFWQHFLGGSFGPAPADRFVLLGDFNNDPQDGEGLKPALKAILNDARLIDTAPQSDGSLAADGGPFDTVDWSDPVPGNLRVDYVLPSADWSVVRSGVFWPVGEMGALAEAASRHKLVWVDLEW